MENIEKLKYPIGAPEIPSVITEDHISEWIKEIENLPVILKIAVKNLDDEQLNTVYRPDGWTLKQVVNHIGDSHLNGICRFKWTLTENRPTIKAYDEKGWAALNDFDFFTIEESVEFITHLHKKFVGLLKSLNIEQLDREFVHPETGVTHTLKKYVSIYAWHGKHHVAHIESLRQRKGW